MPKIYSRAVMERTIEVAIQLLMKVGCEVTQITDEHRVTLDIVIPAEPADPHGERLRSVIEATAAG